jgi:hypothetical protein
MAAGRVPSSRSKFPAALDAVMDAVTDAVMDVIDDVIDADTPRFADAMRFIGASTERMSGPASSGPGPGPDRGLGSGDRRTPSR